MEQSHVDLSAAFDDKSDDPVRLKTGCLFCRSGAEERIIAELKISNPELNAISPKKIRIRRMGGEGVEEVVTLFPGYVFFRTEQTPDFRMIVSRQDVYKYLTYPDGAWELHGTDLAVADLMFAHNGVIGLSKAFYEGNSVKILDGALKDYEGSIIRLNKRAKTAQVKIDFAGKNMTLWLGYEVIEKE